MRRIISTVFRLVFPIAILGIVLWKQQDITDWFKLRNYQPAVAITNLAAADTMTAYAKHVFYINHPDLVADKTVFAQDCTITEQTIVLGCYQSGERGIYIFKVTDKSLNGVEQVTAAHEMLHGAYERLNGSQKARVDELLMNYYQHKLTSKRVKDEINSYKKTEPNELLDEMHSIFGTEIKSLPQELESYYKKYFNNRSAIVAYSDKYQAQFTSRNNQIDAYDKQLAQLKTLINTKEKELSQKSAEISIDKARLESEKSSGQISQYNANVPLYNAEVNDYNSEVDTVRLLISQYNSLVKTRNNLAVDLQSLTSEIDTRPKTVSAQ